MLRIPAADGRRPSAVGPSFSRPVGAVSGSWWWLKEPLGWAPSTFISSSSWTSSVCFLKGDEWRHEAVASGHLNSFLVSHFSVLTWRQRFWWFGAHWRLLVPSRLLSSEFSSPSSSYSSYSISISIQKCWVALSSCVFSSGARRIWTFWLTPITMLSG